VIDFERNLSGYDLATVIIVMIYKMQIVNIL